MIYWSSVPFPENGSNTNIKNAVIALALNAIFKPTYCVVKNANGTKTYKPSIALAKELFLSKYDPEKIQEGLQPVMVYVGRNVLNATQFGVLFDGAKFFSESFLRIFDLAFKYYSVLNIEYPAENCRVWKFVKDKIYQI